MAFCLGKQDLPSFKGYSIYCDYRKTIWFKKITLNTSQYTHHKVCLDLSSAREKGYFSKIKIKAASLNDPHPS